MGNVDVADRRQETNRRIKGPAQRRSARVERERNNKRMRKEKIVAPPPSRKEGEERYSFERVASSCRKRKSI